MPGSRPAYGAGSRCVSAAGRRPAYICSKRPPPEMVIYRADQCPERYSRPDYHRKQGPDGPQAGPVPRQQHHVDRPHGIQESRQAPAKKADQAAFSLSFRACTTAKARFWASGSISAKTAARRSL